MSFSCDKQATLLGAQGLLQAWNFNMRRRCARFGLASEADPKAAMPHWGQAYALGPFIKQVLSVMLAACRNRAGMVMRLYAAC